MKPKQTTFKPPIQAKQQRGLLHMKSKGCKLGLLQPVKIKKVSDSFIRLSESLRHSASPVEPPILQTERSLKKVSPIKLWYKIEKRRVEDSVLFGLESHWPTTASGEQSTSQIKLTKHFFPKRENTYVNRNGFKQSYLKSLLSINCEQGCKEEQLLPPASSFKKLPAHAEGHILKKSKSHKILEEKIRYRSFEENPYFITTSHWRPEPPKQLEKEVTIKKERNWLSPWGHEDKGSLHRPPSIS